MALGRLIFNTNHKTVIEAAGVIRAVLATMTAHTGHEGVQERGCCALVNLTFNANNKTVIMAAGGIPELLAALKAHVGALVQEQGLAP